MIVLNNKEVNPAASIFHPLNIFPLDSDQLENWSWRERTGGDKSFQPPPWRRHCLQGINRLQAFLIMASWNGNMKCNVAEVMMWYFPPKCPKLDLAYEMSMTAYVANLSNYSFNEDRPAHKS